MNWKIKGKMKVNIRLILLNIVLTGAFVFGLNFLSHVILGLNEGVRKIQSHTTADLRADRMANLPNYVNQTELAKIHFKEFNKLKVEYKAFVAWSFGPFQGQTIEIDSHGDRLHQNKRFGKHGDRSAYLFGGSTIWGWGTVNEDTIPALFNSISGMPTFNKGEIGFTSRQSFIRLIELIKSEKKIDVIIFYDGVNDVLALCRTENNLNDHGMSARFKSKLEGSSHKTSDYLQSSDFLQYLDFMFIRGTKTLVAKINRKVFQQAAQDESMNCDNNKEKARQIAESMVKNWEIARELAESRGILFRAILQPVAFIGKPNLDHLQDVASLEDELAKQYKIVYPMIQEIIQKRGHDWILDYTNLLSRDEYIYIDFCHVSKNGNSIVAQQLYSDISSALD